MSTGADRWRRWLVDGLPLLPGAILVLEVVSTWARRAPYPFDLEWMEGGMLVHALRLLRHQPLYVRPTAEWIPYVYPPGYASLLATVFSVTGIDYAPGRVLSMAGTLLAASAVVAFGRRHGATGPGLAGAAVFLGTYRASGAFFDLVRPDGVAAGLLAWTLYLASDRRRGTEVAGGLLLAATFLVKHHVAAFGLPLALVVWSQRDRRHALAFGLWAAVPAGLAALALELRSHHFVDYLLRVPASHPHDWERLFPGTPGELAAIQLPAVALAGAWLLGRLFRGLTARLRNGGLVAACAAGGIGWAVAASVKDAAGVADAPTAVTGLVTGLAGAVAVAAAVHAAGRGRRADGPALAAAVLGATVLGVVGFMRSHNGGFSNVLIPAHLALSFVFPLAAAGARSGAGRAAVALVAALQLGWMASRLDGTPLVPTDEDYAGHDKVLETLARDCPGEILSPYAPWLPYQAGREPGFHLIALWDIAHKTNPFRADVKAVEQAARDHRWGCVVTSGVKKLGFGVDKEYPVVKIVPMSPRAMMPKTGWRVRPTTLQYPRKDADPAPAPEAP